MNLPLLELRHEAARAVAAARQARRSRFVLNAELNATRRVLAATLRSPEAAAICFALGLVLRPGAGTGRPGIWRWIPSLISLRSLQRQFQ